MQWGIISKTHFNRQVWWLFTNKTLLLMAGCHGYNLFYGYKHEI